MGRRGARRRRRRETVGAIGAGHPRSLLGVERDDTEAEAAAARRARARLPHLASAGKMNLSVKDTSGGLLVGAAVHARRRHHQRRAAELFFGASPQEERLYRRSSKKPEPGMRVATGRFGAHMQVSLVNDGPVTFWLQVSPKSRS